MADQFDWVTARSQCSVAAQFELLMTEARANARVRSEILDTSKDRDRFRFRDWRSEDKGNGFTIFDTWASERRAVDVELKETHIAIAAQNVFPGDIQFTVTATLNDEGQCKLKVGDDELEIWQVLKRALEALFFNARS